MKDPGINALKEKDNPYNLFVACQFMNYKFRHHQKVKLLMDANPEYVEYHEDIEEKEQIPIIKGMLGKINIILPNGQYHVEILDKKGNIIAYAPFNEEDLESLE